MRLKKYLNIRWIASIMVMCALLVNAIPLSAQLADTSSTTASSSAGVNEGAADSSALKSASSEPLISTVVDTAASAKLIADFKPEKDFGPLYKSASYYVLLFFLVCVFIAIIGKVLRVYELSGELQGKKTKSYWQNVQGILFIVVLIAGLYGVYWSYTVQGAMSMTIAASEHGEKIDTMFYVTLVITTIVFILTHILLFGFSFKYRGSDTRKAYFYPHNNAVERLWTIIPAITLTVLVVFGFITWRSITNVPKEEQDKALKVEVVGEQFKWNIRYSGTDNIIGKRNFTLITPTNGLGIDYKDPKSWDDKLAGEIVLPVNKPVRVAVGSKDILHSFYIPDFRVQINAVPGMPTSFQFTPKYTTQQMRDKLNDPTFNYLLLCAKICGAGHYNMQAKVTVLSEDEYKAWEAKLPLFYNDDVKKQLQVAQQKMSSENNKVTLITKNNR
ncbi:MAG: cytochrome c oxidase subunit [Sphingobacteriales bacterium]|nr:cytochrome c oxidase subunit [Sphingobacteriales bacterium]